MKERLIDCRGIVKSVMAGAVSVAIMQESACASCAAAAMCHSSEKRQKVVEVLVRDAGRYVEGQEVTIVGEFGLGLRATLWAYAMPLVLLMAVLVVVSRLTGSEGWGALVALVSLVPYYIMLYLLRDRLQRRFTFRIKE